MTMCPFQVLLVSYFTIHELSLLILIRTLRLASLHTNNERRSRCAGYISLRARPNHTVSSRIAALVHAFAERSQPLPADLAQKMLRTLDRLVDMGDRRSAALETSEIFK